VPLAYRLAYSQYRLKPLFEALISLPLVLPPSVLGFYLLLLLSPQSALGAWLLQHFDLRLVFSFSGIVIGSVIYSLPFMVQPIQNGLQNLPTSLLEASRTLGKSDWYSLFHVLLPNIKSAMVTGFVLSFAHTLGEFGVVLMIGGNIPGVTKVASIAIYDEVESLHYSAAHLYAFILVAASLLALWAMYAGKRKSGLGFS
jgi:molybdate transport system permease protein